MKIQRTIRLHALRQGDEVFHDGRWWITGKPVSTTNVNMRTFEIKRGSKVAQLSGHKNSVIRIMRTAPVKEKNGSADKN